VVQWAGCVEVNGCAASPDELSTQASRDRLTGMAREYLDAIRPYLDRMRELAELSEAHPADTDRIHACEDRLEVLFRTDGRHNGPTMSLPRPWPEARSTQPW
jgi:hypothetical protein